MPCRALLILAFILAAAPEEPRPTVVATTSVLSSLIEQLAGEELQALALIQPGHCPGQCDVKPSHLKAIAATGVIFAHGFEGYLAGIESSLAGRPLTVRPIDNQGSWMVPADQLSMAKQIQRSLSEQFPAKKKVFEANYRKLEAELARLESEIAALAAKAGLEGLPVICNVHLVEHLRHIGLNPVATYGRAEDLRASDVLALNEIGRAKKAALVIDNLQAGPSTGVALAQDLKIPHVAISNFPGGLPQTPTLAATALANVGAIVAAHGKVPR